MLPLPEVKQWLKLEESETEEDALLQSLIAAAEGYLRSSLQSWIDPTKNQEAKVFVLALVADMYQNRETTPSIQFAAQLSGMRRTLQSLLAQLRYAYPDILTGALPAGEVGAAYTATLAADGGAPPYTWSISAGALPAGLALDGGTGEVRGTPTEAGRFGVTLELADSNPTPRVVSRQVSITVVEAS